ncbi:MAG: hypothetical protein RLZZ68_1064 [Bacteroidota bacterium]|jgi:hypothetical protein|nr:hypothetical protein [Flavobacteriia bacterium]NBP29009.1 hypothetical protein [Flavobacteriia bacterium]
MRLVALFIFTFSLVVLTPSCSKYPNGPGFTLRTKSNRLVNDWKLTSYMVNGVEYIDAVPQLKMVIEKDGTYSRHSTELVLNQLQSVFEHGTWAFNDEKTSMFLQAEDADLPVEFSIRELRAKKLVIQYYNKITNKTYLYTYTTDK